MKNILKILTVYGLFVVMAIIFSLPTMILWNWLMPTIFGLIKISFLQSLGLNVLSGLLFKNSTTSIKK